MKTPQSIWNTRYSNANKNAISRKYDDWMDRWKHLLQPKQRTMALDIGCGIGLDTRYLTDFGYLTIAADLSDEAIAACRTSMPENPYIQLDAGDGLPFVDSSFQVINANLSLHYFKRVETEKIVNDIKRCLASGGIFFARFNSTSDTNYGSVGYDTIETNVFRVNGLQKSFFDQQSVNELFNTAWKIHSVEELCTERYSKPKIVWEVVAEKF